MTGNDQLNQSLRLRGGLTLSIAQMKSIQDSINKLLEMIPAKYIMLVDTSGQLVCTSGDRGLIDLTILGSLIAADLAASQEIATLTGEFQDYQLILREGDKSHICISEVASQLALLVSFPKSVPIGWARKLIQSTSKEIGSYLSTSESDMSEELKEVVKGELPDLYNDALDQIWKE
jgi:hypothetical protein